ncbi:MAG: DUF3467 domain-containing protein [Anaerolineae bacterium]|nr:DUF3467 domain-containing protein [Anaerolineae bacterium]
MSNESQQNPEKKPPQMKIAIEVPKELEAAYANLAFISHTPAELVIDFAQYLPRTPKGKVVSRVIMSPMHAKMLQLALAQNLSAYERQFGEVKVPQKPSLADELFRFRSGDDDATDNQAEE